MPPPQDFGKIASLPSADGPISHIKPNQNNYILTLEISGCFYLSEAFSTDKTDCDFTICSQSKIQIVICSQNSQSELQILHSADNLDHCFSKYSAHTPWGYAKFLRGMQLAKKKQKKNNLTRGTSNFVYILAIVYLVLVTEKVYLKCFVDKMGYSV